MSKLLFSEKSYDLSMPKELSFITTKESSVCTSMHGNGTAKLHTPTLRAVISYSRLLAEATPTESLGAIGEQTGKFIVAEYIDSKNDMNLVTINISTGKVLASKWEIDSTGSYSGFSPYVLNPGKNDTGSAFFFALMPRFILDPECAEAFTAFHKEAEKGYLNQSLLEEKSYILCDNIWGQIEKKIVPLNIPRTGNIPPISKLAIDQGVYTPTDVIAGEFTVLNVASDNVSIDIDSASFLSKYCVSEETYTPEEQTRIPKIPEWYVIPKEAEMICRHIVDTRESNNPVQNIMIRGAAGTGKSEMAKAIAAAIRVPYVSITCSAGTEIQEFKGQILPCTQEKKPENKLPSYLDFKYDPLGTYEALTGLSPESVEEEVLFEQLMKAVENKQSSEGTFLFVESPFVEAMRYGYLCEIQEISAIGDPAVLNGINAALDGCQSITLDTGEIIYRHPNTLFIFTANIGYEGSRGINQSIISRMQMVFDIDTLNADTMAERVEKVTGFKDPLMLRKMVECTISMEKSAKESGIRDGSIGMRELIAWAQSTMITKNPLESALFTILPSASSDADNRTLLQGCLDNYF